MTAAINKKTDQSEMLEFSNADDEYFGDNVFSVKHLLAWLDAKGLVLPVYGSVKSGMFVQVCALLSEVQNYAYETISDEKAYALALRGLAHPENFYKPASRIKISFDAAGQWRDMLISAVQSGELMLLDYASKLPVLAPASEPASRIGQGSPKGDDGHEWKSKAWALAAEIHAVNLARGWGHDKQTVAGEIAKMFGPDQLDLKTKTGRPIDRAYIVRYALGGWRERFGMAGKMRKK